jgi:YD repeat-containing protein
MDGTHETMNYSCCGLSSKVDREGVTTTYAYDDLKRRTAETRLDITLSCRHARESIILKNQRST